MGRSTAEAGQHVVGVAAVQATEVAGEARRQAKDLLGEARAQATDQARMGQQHTVEGLRSLAGELHQMAEGGDSHGPASDLAAQAAERIDGLVGWLDRREPGDLLGEVRAYARRRPGTFLLGAAVAGVLAGRLARGAVDANRNGEPMSHPPQAAPQPGHGPQQAVPHPAALYPPVLGHAVPAPYTPPAPSGQPPNGGPPMPPPPMAAPLGDPGYPPPAHPAAQGYPTRTGATTVGEYVDEIGQGQPRRDLHADPRDRP